ncbi:MAG: TetR/AcrR family transcriptional regulator [Bacteroidia bacterium]|nr:TetR/AcrR family transcriptional regulator [Bacteroidia bacterium]
MSKKKYPTEDFNHKERREREKAAVKSATLHASRKLAKELGWPNVSIRKIAREIQYTPPVIYQHFANKEAILMELEGQGFRKLQYALEETMEKGGDPIPRLLDLTATAWDWAFKEADLYQVMFNLDSIHATPPNRQALSESAAVVLKTLKEIHLFDSQVEEYFYTWWALLHGYISLIMSEQVQGNRNRMRQFLLDAVKRFAQSL